MIEIYMKEWKRHQAILNWFVGQVMKETKGCADPLIARQILVELLYD